MAALYITHDLAVAAQVSDEIMVLQHGNTVEHGETDQIINRPKEDYTRALVSVRSIEHEEKAPTDAPVLKIENICARYPGLSADVVKNIDVELHAGQTLAVVGESGWTNTPSGSSMLMVSEEIAPVASCAERSCSMCSRKASLP